MSASSPAPERPKLEAAGSSPGPEWWSKFGDAYDAAESLEDPQLPSSIETRQPSDAAEALQDQMALNARTLAQVRAKSQLLEVAETSSARLRIELAEA